MSGWVLITKRILPWTEASKSESLIKLDRLFDRKNEYVVLGSFWIQERQPSRDERRADTFSMMAGPYQAKTHDRKILSLPIRKAAGCNNLPLFFGHQVIRSLFRNPLCKQQQRGALIRNERDEIIAFQTKTFPEAILRDLIEIFSRLQISDLNEQIPFRRQSQAAA